MRRAYIAILAFLLGAVGSPARSGETPEAVRDFQVLTPRPFGYAIGDLIRQKLIVDVDRSAVLDRNSIPNDRINRWLEVREAKVTEEERGDLRRYVIELAYQTFYAPLEVKNLAIPAFNLVFNQNGDAFQLEVPNWVFTTAPIRELSVLREEGLEPMRPDLSPVLADGNGPRLRLSFAMVVGGGACLYLAYLYGYLPWQQRGRHFRATYRSLRTLNRAAQTSDYAAAYTAVHRAFNGVYGQPLFSERLEAFFEENPAFRPLRAEIEAFFASSYEFFFSERGKETSREGESGSEGGPSGEGEGTAFSMSRLLRLCRDCYDIERTLR